MKGQSGAFASQVFIGSPAAKGGIQAGDYIIAINGKDVKSQNELMREVGYLPADKVAEFTVLRAGKKINLKVKIEERTDKVSADNSKLWPGFIVSPLNDKLKEKLEITDSKVKGVVVNSVLEKSPAAALRIQNGDVITAVNDKKVKNVQEFYAALDLSRNKEIWFDVYSNGHTISTGRYKLD